MVRKALSIAVILLCVYLLVPKSDDVTNRNRNQETAPPAIEMETKRHTWSQDNALTQEMYTKQCSAILSQTLAELQKGNEQQQLVGIRNQHPYIKQLLWFPTDGQGQAVMSGELPKSLERLAASRKDEARRHLKTNDFYQSEPVRYRKNTYIVFGTSQPDRSSQLIGVMDQSHLRKLAVEQRKNLRLVPYPSDKRFSVQSADADTMKKVRVRSPEDNEGTSHYFNRDVVVRFRNKPDEQTLRQIQREIGCKKVRKLNNTYIFTSEKWDTERLLRYFKHKNVEYVEPHYLYLTNFGWNQEDTRIRNEPGTPEPLEPNDSLFRPYQWNLPVIEALEGWNYNRGSEDVIVAVLDTGVDLEHTDLQGNLVGGYNAVEEGANPGDDVGHGTHVAGVISALVNNGEGIAGISWYNKIMPVKVLDSTGAGSTYAVAQGVIRAVDAGAKVINMSLGNYAEAEFLHDAIKYAYERDVVIVAAAGNDNTDTPGYPAAYPEVLAVSATDTGQSRASFSNFGDYIDVAAPGVSIPSTYPGNQYAAMSGTSMASPHAAALAAMIRSARPDLSNAEVMDIMRNTSVDLGAQGQDSYFGYGQIDVKNALSGVTGRQNDNADTGPATGAGWLRDQLESIKKWLGS